MARLIFMMAKCRGLYSIYLQLLHVQSIFVFSNIISRGSASNFIEKIMLLESALAQTKVGFGRVIFPVWGPSGAQFVLL